jgi:transposase
MKKKAYRAIEVKKINVEELESRHGEERVVFGVDVAKTDFYSSLMDEGRKVLVTIKWKHPQETPIFVALVKRFSKAEVAFEPSGTYGDPVRYLLAQAGIGVYRVSPKRSHDAAEVYDGVPSLHDAKSAAIISKLHLDGASEEWGLRTDHQRDLVSVLTSLDMLSQQFHQNTNRLESLMAMHWPGIGAYVKFKQVTFLELLIQIGGATEVANQEAEARELMQRVGGHFFSKTKNENIIKCSKENIGLPMTEVELEELQSHAARTLALYREIQGIKKRVEALSQQSESTKNISHVVGKSTASVIVTFSGDPAQYETSNHWLKSFGLNLKEKSSGKHKGRLMITRRGSGRSRRWLYFAALRLIQHDETVKAWYAQKVARDGGIKMKAIIAIMRKLVKALWYVARGDEFDTSKMFDRSHLGLAA